MNAIESLKQPIARSREFLEECWAKLNNETWHIVKSTPKVTGFLGGGMDPSSIPPISEGEVREITHQMEEGAVKPKPKVLFEQGEQVKVVDGPFQDFNGVVEEVKPD